MNISEVREKYPQYKDLSDEQLAKGLHSKFYSDMPYEQFAAKIGLNATKTPTPETTAGGVASEIGKGLARGASDTARLGPQVATQMLDPFNTGVGKTIMGALDKLSSRDKVQATPQTEAERFAGTASEIVGAGVAGGGANSVRNAALTAASGLTGATGEQVAGQTGKLVGSLAPAAAAVAGSAAKTAIANRMAPRIATFEAAGAKPSVGQATEFNFLQGFENLLSKFPGGQGIFRKFAENQQTKLGATTTTGVAAEDAGRAIERGIKDAEKGFIKRTHDAWVKLDDAAAAKVPAGSAMAPMETTRALDELTSPVAGAERTTKALANKTLVELRNNLEADMLQNGGKLPFEALRSLRTKIGSMMEETLVSGVPGGELKRLYGAMSKDLEAAANQAGAGKEFARQSNFYKARMERIEGVLQRVIGNTPEETFAKFMPKDAEQATKVRAVMRSLDPEQRQIVTDAVVNRLGRATPGKQSAAGDVFSPETFLTNWNRLSPGAKAQLFSSPDMRKNLNALADTTENLRSGAQVFANPSGSAGAAAPYGMGYLAAVGNFLTLGTLAGGAMVGAKMMTSPKVVEVLAKLPTAKDKAVHLARLGAIFNETKDPELKAELSKFVQSKQ